MYPRALFWDDGSPQWRRKLCGGSCLFSVERRLPSLWRLLSSSMSMTRREDWWWFLPASVISVEMWAARVTEGHSWLTPAISHRKRNRMTLRHWQWQTDRITLGPTETSESIVRMCATLRRRALDELLSAFVTADMNAERRHPFIINSVSESLGARPPICNLKKNTDGWGEN